MGAIDEEARDYTINERYAQYLVNIKLVQVLAIRIAALEQVTPAY